MQQPLIEHESSRSHLKQFAPTAPLYHALLDVLDLLVDLDYPIIGIDGSICSIACSRQQEQH